LPVEADHASMSPRSTAILTIPRDAMPVHSPLDALATIPEEEVWLASRRSPDTRRVDTQDIHHFLRALGITSRDELRRVDRKAVRVWERSMREVQGLHPTTIRRRLSALSSLFTHLVR
jgi:site-specific recombinase XerC